MYYSSACLRKTASGKYCGVLKHKNDSGKWTQKTHTLKATGKRAAQKELDEWREAMEAEQLDQQRQGAALAALGLEPTERLTVGAYVRRYINGKRHEIEPSTFNEYGRDLEKLIGPYLGDIELNATELNPDTVRAWVAQVSEIYAPVTVKKSLTLLRSAMNQAIDNDLMTKDPTRGVKPPKQGRPKPNVLTPDEVRILLDVLKVARMSPAMLGVKMALFTGMREGEICGLRWKNVNPAGGVLRVDEAIGRDGGRFYLKEPKNAGSVREVYFGSELASDLAERREAVNAECRAAGVPFSGDMFVLGDIRGGFLRPIYISNKWRGLADALEFKGSKGMRPQFRDMRHTFPTMAIAAGVDVKTVSSMMGHSNAAMTLNTYADALPESKQRAAGVVQDALTGSEGQ